MTQRPGLPAHRLRRVELDDAHELWEATLAMALDGRGMVLDPDEVSLDRTRKNVARFVERGEQALMLVAEVEGVVVGAADIWPLPRRRLAHVAEFTMGLHPEHQGRGLGRQLAQACVAWADERGILRLQLMMRADNDRAKALYTSLGFALESTRRDFMRLGEGFVDDLVMSRYRTSDST